MSDLHADRPEGGKVESHLDMTVPDSQPFQNPLAGLLELVKEERLTAQLLLCAGDVTHKAKPEPLQYAWERVHRVANALGAGLTAGTAGNHDVDSRYDYNEFDAKGMLQAVSPPFPLPEDSANDKYWSRNFALAEREAFRLVVLNSSAYHGGRPEEIAHGRVSANTLAALRRALTAAHARDPKPVSFLLCHHHPERQEDLPVPDYDVMQAGADLVTLLGRGDFGRWIIVHGHKHNPQIGYARGGATSPLILSAGSLSAVLYPELQTRVRNQFYLIEVHLDALAAHGLVGRGRAWDFVTGRGWVAAGPSSGLPAEFGFGCRTDPALLAAQIATLGGEPRPWNEVVTATPAIEYLLPNDFVRLEQDLDREHQLAITVYRGRPAQIGSKL